jgi:hypothetical protein
MNIFDVQVGGTVSDWCMVIVTAITAYYLYQTLKSQKEVQATQAKLYEIESLRFRESIKPQIQYSLHESFGNIDKEDKEILTIEASNTNGNLALSIRPIYVHENESAKPVFSHPNPKHHVKGDKPLYLHFVVDKQPKFAIFFTFMVVYKDISGTIYKQRVLCIKDHYGVEINPSLPEVISEEDEASLPKI